MAVLEFAFWGPVGAIILAGRHGPIYTYIEWTLLLDLALYQTFAASGKIHWGFGGGHNFCWGQRPLSSLKTAPGWPHHIRTFTIYIIHVRSWSTAIDGDLQPLTASHARILEYDADRHSFVVSAPATWNNIPASILRFWYTVHFQNCSENPPLYIRLHAMPLTAIHRRLRFTPVTFAAK